MPHLYVLDRDGDPQRETSAQVWGEWFKSLKNRRIAYTQVSDGVVVSTIFLGIPSNGFLWETRVLGSEPAFFRLSNSRASALQTHAETVDRYATIPKIQEDS